MREDFEGLWKDYLRIEQAILYLERNFREQPTLGEIARSANLSEYHFHRLFRRWAGITPKQFLQLLTIEYAKNMLDESRSLLEITYNSGLSSTSRLHDLFVTIDAVTPGEFRRKGGGLTILYGVHPTPFGKCLLSVTERGICGLSFLTGENLEEAVSGLKKEWAGARFVEDAHVTRGYIDTIFVPSTSGEKPGLNLYLKGTNFQIKVWQALLGIPPERILSYDDVAESVSTVDGLKIVGEAVMTNPVAYVIPCHRVIHRIGIVGPYKWGTARKRAMLGWEAARGEAAAHDSIDSPIILPDEHGQTKDA